MIGGPSNTAVINDNSSTPVYYYYYGLNRFQPYGPKQQHSWRPWRSSMNKTTKIIRHCCHRSVLFASCIFVALFSLLTSTTGGIVNGQAIIITDKGGQDDCHVTPWAEWGSCLGSCDFGLRVRNRDVDGSPTLSGTRHGTQSNWKAKPCPQLYQVKNCIPQGCQQQSAGLPIAQYLNNDQAEKNADLSKMADMDREMTEDEKELAPIIILPTNNDASLLNRRDRVLPSQGRSFSTGFVPSSRPTFVLSEKRISTEETIDNTKYLTPKPLPLFLHADVPKTAATPRIAAAANSAQKPPLQRDGLLVYAPNSADDLIRNAFPSQWSNAYDTSGNAETFKTVKQPLLFPAADSSSSRSSATQQNPPPTYLARPPTAPPPIFLEYDNTNTNSRRRPPKPPTTANNSLRLSLRRREQVEAKTAAAGGSTATTPRLPIINRNIGERVIRPSIVGEAVVRPNDDEIYPVSGSISNSPRQLVVESAGIRRQQLVAVDSEGRREPGSSIDRKIDDSPKFSYPLSTKTSHDERNRPIITESNPQSPHNLTPRIPQSNLDVSSSSSNTRHEEGNIESRGKEPLKFGILPRRQVSIFDRTAHTKGGNERSIHEGEYSAVENEQNIPRSRHTPPRSPKRRTTPLPWEIVYTTSTTTPKLDILEISTTERPWTLPDFDYANDRRKGVDKVLNDLRPSIVQIGLDEHQQSHQRKAAAAVVVEHQKEAENEDHFVARRRQHHPYPQYSEEAHRRRAAAAAAAAAAEKITATRGNYQQQQQRPTSKIVHRDISDYGTAASAELWKERDFIDGTSSSSSSISISKEQQQQHRRSKLSKAKSTDEQSRNVVDNNNNSNIRERKTASISREDGDGTRRVRSGGEEVKRRRSRRGRHRGKWRVTGGRSHRRRTRKRKSFSAQDIPTTTTEDPLTTTSIIVGPSSVAPITFRPPVIKRVKPRRRGNRHGQRRRSGSSSSLFGTGEGGSLFGQKVSKKNEGWQPVWADSANGETHQNMRHPWSHIPRSNRRLTTPPPIRQFFPFIPKARLSVRRILYMDTYPFIIRRRSPLSHGAET